MNDDNNEGIGEDIKELMENNDIDKDTAERVQELIDEGLDEDEAVELEELL